MTLVRFDDVTLEFGHQVLLKKARLVIEPGERVCLIGRNGTGKTSLMRLITGTLAPDDGEIQFRGHIRISQLDQNLPEGLDRTVRETVSEGLESLRKLHARYEQLSKEKQDTVVLREIEDLQQQIEGQHGWNIDQSIDTILTEMQLPGEKKMSELSGGWRRRVALARALISKPDLLLLDEPTNHLDIATIDWLENTIYSWPGSVMFVTHDRAFLQRLATRIVELDRGQLVSWPGDYQNYLRRKEKTLEDEATANARFDKKLAQEEGWIRQGVKARRKRNEGRKRALMEMREQAAARLKVEGKAHISIDQAESSGRKVIRAKNACYSYTDEPLVDHFSLKVMRGDRIGLVGNNGVGKSTLLRLMLGEIEPQRGTVKLGTNLEVGYFDQLRQELKLDKNVAENISEHSDYVTINGKSRHVIGYLKGFLFSPDRSITKVSALSGGEKNRLSLAKLFARPTNLIVLDEPTNDLDMETLEVLEDRLIEYQGTLIVVSHDREFLDNVVTSILVFEDDGEIHHYVGGYSDWARRGHELAITDRIERMRQRELEAKELGLSGKGGSPKKLGYKQQRELDQLPATIEKLEQRADELQQEIAAPEFYSQDYEATQNVLEKLKGTNEEIERCTTLWAELEEQQERYTSHRGGKDS